MKIITKILLLLFILCGLSTCKPSNDKLCLLTVDITCFKGTGSAELYADASGGIEPYDYDWDNGTNTNGNAKLVTWNGSILRGDGPGTHRVVVYDARGCTAEASVTVLFPCDSLRIVRDADGNSYNVISIGNQCWMSSNLKVSASIPQVTDSATWVTTTSPAWCYYNNSSTNAAYGKLYNWYAVQSGNLCPAGWHISTLADWQELENLLGNEPAGKLKLTNGWDSPNTAANNNSGFSAMPAGFRSYLSSHFNGFGQYTGFWTSTQASDSTAHFRAISYDSAWLTSLFTSKRQGYSCRCVRD